MPDIQKQSLPVDQSSASEAGVKFTPGGLPAADDFDELTTFFRVRNHYILSQGVIGAPICKPPAESGPSMAFAAVNPPVAALTVEWQSWRKGLRSIKPRPYVRDGNCILLDERIDLDNLEIEGDSLHYFISSGSYLYSFVDRGKVTLSHPLPPYIELPDKSVLVLADSDFPSGIHTAGWMNTRANNAVTKASQ